MGSSLCFENDPSCVVLYSLQLVDAVAGSAVEHSIAVVDPGEDQTTSQCLCHTSVLHHVVLELVRSMSITALCCVLYDTCAQRYAHKYEQFLNLCLVRVRLVFVCF